MSLRTPWFLGWKAHPGCAASFLATANGVPEFGQMVAALVVALVVVLAMLPVAHAADAGPGISQAAGGIALIRDASTGHLNNLQSSNAAATSAIANTAASSLDMEPRVRACTACHGEQGRATPDGYFPRIAGKPAGYLANQLLNFKAGRRTYPAMGYLVEHLSDAYLGEMAAYFAGLDLPYPPPAAVKASAAALERGRALVQVGDAVRRIPACVNCHGAAMTGVQPSTPGLLGLPRDYLNSQLGAWATGQRHARAPDCMAEVAKALSSADVSAVSAWLAAQPVPANGHPAERLPKAAPLKCAPEDAAS